MAKALSEHGLIEKYFAPLAAPGGLRLLDDAAFLEPSPGHDIVVSVDAVVAGVHFLPGDDPRDIAFKALGVNVSDLIAKGATPKGFLLALGLEDGGRQEWLQAFAAGLGEAASLWRCPLYGGDTVRTDGALFLSVTAFGEVPAGGMVRRGDARAGDRICVSGTIGDAALGLALAAGPEPEWAASLPEQQRAFLLGRYRRPQPRQALLPVLREFATAAMDVSDGLVGDLAKLLHASGVSAEVDLGQVPLSPAARAVLAQQPAALERIATGGDDYEILCTVAEDRLTAAVDAARAAGCALQTIGTIVAAGTPPMYRYNGRPASFSKGAFSHF